MNWLLSVQIWQPNGPILLLIGQKGLLSARSYGLDPYIIFNDQFRFQYRYICAIVKAKQGAEIEPLTDPAILGLVLVGH